MCRRLRSVAPVSNRINRDNSECQNLADSLELLFECSPKSARPTICHIFTPTMQDDVAVFGIDPIELIAGKFPRRQRRLVEAWAEVHQAELLADWEQLQAGEPPYPIEPLK